MVLHLLEGVVTFPRLELCPTCMPQLEVCLDWNSAPVGTMARWISLSCRTHLLSIILRKIRSLLFHHHLDEKLDLKLDFVILANPFDATIEAHDAWNIAMCLHSFKHFECSGIKSVERVLGASYHLLTYGKGCLCQTLDDRSMVVLRLLEGVVTFPLLVFL